MKTFPRRPREPAACCATRLPPPEAVKKLTLRDKCRRDVPLLRFQHRTGFQQHLQRQHPDLDRWNLVVQRGCSQRPGRQCVLPGPVHADDHHAGRRRNGRTHSIRRPERLYALGRQHTDAEHRHRRKIDPQHAHRSAHDLDPCLAGQRCREIRRRHLDPGRQSDRIGRRDRQQRHAGPERRQHLRRRHHGLRWYAANRRRQRARQRRREQFIRRRRQRRWVLDPQRPDAFSPPRSP